MLALNAAGARKDSRDYDLWNAMDKASDEVAKVFAQRSENRCHQEREGDCDEYLPELTRNGSAI